MNIIVLGPQGSGKGTQAELLSKKFDLEHIEMGKLLRDVAKTDTPLGKKIHETINIQGKLVDDKIIEEVLQNNLLKVPKEKGIVFDGVPRNDEQTRYFEGALKKLGRNLDLVIDIVIPEEESISRLSKRWLCKKNEHLLIMGTDVQSEKDPCPQDGSEIFQRIDDTPERIKTRLGIYYNDTKDVTEYYRKRGLLIEVDGTPSIEEVNKQILAKIQEKFEDNKEYANMKNDFC